LKTGSLLIKSSLCLIFGLSLLACNRQPEIVAVSGPTMGTSYHVKYWSAEDVDSGQIALDLQQRLDQVNGLMSTYLPSSEVSRFNEVEPGQWFVLSPETFDVIDRALYWCEQSDGAFDITVSALVNLWGFGPGIRTSEKPAQQDIDAALQQVGCDHIQLDESRYRIRKDRNLAIDLSAIAKGYAVDQLADYLESVRVTDYLVEVGGELRVGGTKPDAEVWKIAVESPVTETREVERVLQLENVAVATSGDYRNYFEEDGIRYSHTIDPATGYPISHTLASVSVLIDNCMDADALATSFMVMGPEKALEFANQRQLAIFMIVKAGDTFAEQASELFEARYLQ